jgi:sec-independent protein translocase protein TatC
MPETKTKSESIITPEIQAAIDRYLPYLEDIRKKVLIVVGVFLTTTLITGFNYQTLIKFALKGFNLEGINMVLTSPNQIIELGVTTGMFCGLLVAAPLLVYFLLSFLKPALSPPEYKLIISLIPASFILFILGFGFGIWVMRFVVGLFAQTAIGLDMSNLWDISMFFNQILVSGLLLGFLFQFPIVLTILMRLKVIQRQMLVNQRVYVYAGILIIAAILPPTDIFSLLFLTIPLFLLFEITLLLNRPAN